MTTTQLDTGYYPRPLQAELHIETAKVRFAVWNLHRRFGKCNSAATLVPTTDGFKKIKDIQIGEYVFDHSGKPTEVVGTYYGGRKETYKVTFSTGEFVLCDDEHLWYTEPYYKDVPPILRHIYSGCGSVVRTKDISYKRPFIPLCGPVEYGKKDLPIDPYLLGYWLGNGASDDGTIYVCFGDEHVVEKYTDSRYKKVGCHRYGINGLKVKLRGSNLYKNKHIPDIYMQASVEQRIALLQGLMDSDGTVTVSGTCAFDSKSERLMDGTVQLIRSLGLRTRKLDVGRDELRCLYRAKTFSPFRLERKDKLVNYNERPIRRKIVSVENTKVMDDFYCISVASKMNLFLCTESYIPTHNTVAAINDQLDYLLFLDRRQPQGVYIAPTYGQAKRVAWDYYKLFASSIPGTEFKEGELCVIIPRPHKGDVVKIWLLGAENPTTILGMYLDHALFDEFGSMNPIVWSKVTRPALSDRRGRGLFIGTPQGQNHFFDIYQAASEPDMHDWYARTITAEESGYVAEDELISARRTMTKDEYASEYMCSFTAAMTGAYYSEHMAAAEAEGRIGEYPHDPNSPVSTFWDLGILDSMSIWFIQKKGDSFIAIDYIEDVGKGVPHYIKLINQKPYIYAKHYCPHDVKKRELSTGVELITTMENLGLRPLFRVPKCAFVKDNINSVRMVLPMMKFDRIKCGDGIKALKNYQAKYDNKKKKYVPLHDWTSHAADAMACFGRGRDDSSFVPSHTLNASLPTKALSEYNELEY